MKNITVSVDEGVLREVRKYAAERDTTVNALVCAHLADLVARKERVREAVKRIDELAKMGGMEIGPKTWTRDDLYER